MAEGYPSEGQSLNGYCNSGKTDGPEDGHKSGLVAANTAATVTSEAVQLCNEEMVGLVMILHKGQSCLGGKRKL